MLFMYDTGIKPWEIGIYNILIKVDGLVSLTAHMVLSAKYSMGEWYCLSILTLCAWVGLSHSGTLTWALCSSSHTHFNREVEPGQYWQVVCMDASLLR